MKNKNQKTFVKFCRKCVSFVRCGFNFIHLTGKLKLNFSINRNESRVEITMFNTYCTHNVPYIMIVSGCAVCSVLCAQQCSGKSVVKFLIETVLNVFVCASVRVCMDVSLMLRHIKMSSSYVTHSCLAAYSDRLGVIIGIKHACVNADKVK